MKFTLCVVALTIMVSVDAVPAPAIELPATDPGFFKKKLDSVQGAIKDSIRAGMDLQIMEGKLKAIVAASSFFWMTESATEYATAKNAYANGWKAGEPAIFPKPKAKKNNGESCDASAECKSNNCSFTICQQGTKPFSKACDFNEECSGNFCSNDRCSP